MTDKDLIKSKREAVRSRRFWIIMKNCLFTNNNLSLILVLLVSKDFGSCATWKWGHDQGARNFGVQEEIFDSKGAGVSSEQSSTERHGGKVSRVYQYHPRYCHTQSKGVFK